jgi:hypothetical protein
MLLFNTNRCRNAPSAGGESNDSGSFVSANPRLPHGSRKAGIHPHVDLVTPSGSYTQIPIPPLEDLSAVSGEQINVADSPTSTSPTQPSKHEEKRLKQLRRWVETTVPEMVQPFLDMMADSRNLRDVDRAARRCTCLPTVHMLQVLCVHINSE